MAGTNLTGSPENRSHRSKSGSVGNNPETLDIEGPAKQALKPGGTESGAPAVSCMVPKFDRFCNEKLPRVGEALERGQPADTADSK